MSYYDHLQRPAFESDFSRNEQSHSADDLIVEAPSNDIDCSDYEVPVILQTPMSSYNEEAEGACSIYANLDSLDYDALK